MLNFNDLKLVVLDAYSFVGIAKERDQLLFYLPKGFDERIEGLNQFNAKRDLFFQLYRVLRRFRAICLEKGYLDASSDLQVRDRDGILRGESGATIVRTLDESTIFYSKLDGVGALLNAYDELKIISLASRLGRSDRINLNQLHRYLHQGIFMSNGAVYVDEMQLPRQQVQVEATDIVSMYCYLVAEVKQQIEDEINPEIAALAERFQQHYIGTEASLFNEHDQAIMVDLLKEALDTIDQRTALKDLDYDEFYAAIEAFLYGNWRNASNGELWGISNFHAVWESMCLTRLAERVEPASILWLDDRFVPNSLVQQINAAAKSINLNRTFICNGAALMPDAVVFPALFLAASPANSQVYKLESSNWDDYFYRTSFSCKSETFNEDIRIAYVGQPIQSHTIQELRSFYASSRHYLHVTSPLPSHFYSYWIIDFESDDLAAQWAAMRYFNHVFYLALQRGAWTFEAFRSTILTALEVKDYIGSSNNVFGSSLFRDRSMRELKNCFVRFVQEMLRFDVIDIKYLTIDYLQNPQKIEEIKLRSIRKQFVYEYLLQQELLVKIDDSSISPSIISSFWVPDFCEKVLVAGPEYLDGYLELIKVGVAALIDRYIQVKYG